MKEFVMRKRKKERETETPLLLRGRGNIASWQQDENGKIKCDSHAL